MSLAEELLESLSSSKPILAIQASLKLIDMQLTKADQSKDLNKRESDQLKELSHKMKVKVNTILKKKVKVKGFLYNPDKDI